jgi:hypothetical protein
MDYLVDTAQAIGLVESGGNYRYQTAARIDGRAERKVGAYGIVESKIGLLAEAMGIPGADWRDPAVQDKMVKEHLRRSFQELDSWDLSAIAFRYGMPIARYFKANGITEPGDMEAAGYKQQGEYLRSVRRKRPNKNMPVEGKLTSPDIAVPKDQTVDGRGATPNRRRAENIVRQRLVMMRNAQRRGLDNLNVPAEEEPMEETA